MAGLEFVAIMAACILISSCRNPLQGGDYIATAWLVATIQQQISSLELAMRLLVKAQGESVLAPRITLYWGLMLQ